MLVAFVFEWQFSPARFFQDLSEISVRGYLAQIERETIRVLISRTQIGNTAPNDVQTELSRELETIFLSQQLITGLPFSLNENGIYEQYEDGHRVGLISATINIACASAFMSDFIHKNKYGEVIQDTKKQRDAYKALVRKVVKDKFDRDSCLRTILRSYHQSLQDPRNSLIYLYEVIENLEVRLGGSNNSDARKTMVSELSQFRLFELGGECIFDPSLEVDKCLREIDKTCSSQYCVSKLTQRMLKRLGQIANNKEIRQGRHRGQTLEELRDVELGEMSEAVKTARCLIEAYLRWLDSEG